MSNVVSLDAFRKQKARQRVFSLSELLEFRFPKEYCVSDDGNTAYFEDPLLDEQFTQYLAAFGYERDYSAQQLWHQYRLYVALNTTVAPWVQTRLKGKELFELTTRGNPPLWKAYVEAVAAADMAQVRALGPQVVKPDYSAI